MSDLANGLLKVLQTDSQKIVILVGTNYQFHFITKASEFELRQRNVRLPNIDGLRYFKGPNDISIVQIDDIYKKRNLQQLIKAGVRKVILVGSQHTDGSVFLENFFYWITGRIIVSVHPADFEITNLTKLKL